MTKKFFGSNFINNEKNKSEAGVVYKIPCNECELLYFGETSDLKRRLYQHKYALQIGDNNSSLHRHRERFNHKIVPGNATPILKANNPDKRRFIETFLINNVRNFNENKKISLVWTFSLILLLKNLRSCPSLWLTVTPLHNQLNMLIIFFMF